MFFQLNRFARKLTLQFGRERFHRELEEEIAAHRALKLDQQRRLGASPEEAANQTRREMGNLTLAAERSADVRQFTSFEQLIQDIRYSLRLLRKNLGFSLIAVLSLALGIGGNTAVFSVVNALFIKPLPFPEPQRLVRITEFFPKALLVYLRDHCRTMDIASASPRSDLNFTGEGPAFRAAISRVSANLFTVLGVSPHIGQTFAPNADQPGRDSVVLISYSFWKERFQSDPAIIGQTITVGGVPRTIVGIMPPNFSFPSSQIELWLPAPIDPRSQIDYWAGDFTPLVARLRPGATISQAAEEIKPLVANVWRMFPWPMPRAWNADATVISLQTDLAGDARRPLLVLLCAVGVVLLIACANVAGLLTARGVARSKEFAMRTALGAGHFRIVRQLLAESIVLAGSAGVIGIALAALGLRLFTAVIPPDVPAISGIGIDWNVAAFTAVLSLFAGLAFGMAPALNAARLDILSAIRTGGQRSADTKSVSLRSSLIAGEIALTVVLVTSAGMLVRGLYSLSKVNPGFNSQRVMTVRISPDKSFCRQSARCIAFYQRIIDQSRDLTGVTNAAVANTLPLDGSAPSLSVDVEGHPKTAGFPAPMFWSGAVSADYLRLFGIPLLAGRSFTPADTRLSEPVVLISASTARRFWPGEPAVGKHIKWTGEDRWRTIVGVVADVRQYNLANRRPSGIAGAMYMPYTQAVDPNGQIPAAMYLIVKTGVNIPTLSSQLRRIVAADPNVPVDKIVPMDGLLANSLSGFRSTTLLLICFASVALALASTGIYGLVSYSVSQRSYEIALRMAIGASAWDILRMILMTSLKLALAGSLCGLAIAVPAGQGLSVLLSEAAPAAPLIYALVIASLLAVTLAASAVPALRGARIDPIRTLRTE